MKVSGRLLELDSQSFQAQFPDKPFTVRHNLVNHPLFSVQRLLELAKSLPERDVEYNAGDIPINLGNQLSPRTGLSAEETVRRIQECRSWMVLKRVEQDPAYGRLLDQCLDEVHEYSEGRVRGMFERVGFIFLSSPNSVTPLHLDPEHNFLLQIMGRKKISIFDPKDTMIITEAQIEQGVFSKVRNLVYKEELQPRGQIFELHPGMGAHVPLVAPHWVRNMDEVSVSFSITFQSEQSERQMTIHDLNSRLRARGFSPKPVGHSHLNDTLKYHTGRALTRARRVLGIKKKHQASY